MAFRQSESPIIPRRQQEKQNSSNLVAEKVKAH
jgi:hypothetical protein